MISNFDSVTGATAHTYVQSSLPAGSDNAAGTKGSQTTMSILTEYFASESLMAAKSDVDYLTSPIQQIRDQMNAWFANQGSPTQLQCDDATWVVAPSAQIPAEFFAPYEPFFKIIHLYQADLNSRDDDMNAPSDQQMNAAFLGLANLMAALVPAPSPMLLEDGTIGGYWRRGQCYVSIDFEVDGEHTWAGTNGTTFHSGTWQLPGNSIPPALTRELRSIVI